MGIDVENHVKSCKSCARRKARNAVAAVPIQGYRAPTMPWERIHIDLTGPLTTTTLGNKYIVVMKDALTRYVETAAIKDKSADLVVDAFIQCVVYRHGAVGTLVSDNGREFVNKLFAQVAQLLKIKHHTITEYNPRANGLAENHMRTMKDALSIYCDESQSDWDLHLNGVSAAYNTTINSQTGFTPFFMLYGREARLPSETWLRSFGQTTGIIPYVNNLVRALTNVWDAAASTKPVELQRMREGQKPIRHLQFAEYKVGDYAMIANTPKSQNIGWVDAKFRKLNLKLQPRYSGPYLIVKRVSPVVYVISELVKLTCQ
jgi:transposase InsO family protein